MKLGLHEAAVVALSMLVAAGAVAQPRGWSAKLGVGQVSPQVHSGDITPPARPHTKGDMGDDARPVFSVGYALDDKLALSFDAGLPFRLDLLGAGALAGTGRLGTVRASAPTVLLQYHAATPAALFRPYVGLGLTYARFSHETGSAQLTAIANTGGAPVTFAIDRRYAPTLQAGLSVNIDQHWFADFVICKTRLRSVATFSTGQQLDMRIDPKFTAVGMGYRF